MIEKIDFDFDNIFNRKLSEMIENNKLYNDKLINKVFYNEHAIEYKYNSIGYRSEEFGSHNIMTLGCSYTFGTGLNIEQTWPYMLSNKMSMSYANLSYPGDSMQGQVIKAFQYFKEFGHPQYIFGVFPIARFEMPYVKDKMCKVDGPLDINIKKSNLKFIQKCNSYIHDFEKISKAPHNPNTILPFEFAIFYNLMFIQMLEQYCLSNNIKIVWTIWEQVLSDPSQTTMQNKINSNNFFIEKSLSIKDLSCHKEYNKDPLFKNAADYNFNKLQGHWGFHKHIHLSDTMYSLVN